MNLSLVLAKIGYDQNNPTHYFQLSEDSSEWLITASSGTVSKGSIFVSKHPSILEKDRNMHVYDYDHLSWLNLIILDFSSYTPPTDVPC